MGEKLNRIFHRVVGGQVVGEATFYTDRLDPADSWLSNLEVRDGQKKKGFGRQLVEEAIREAKGGTLRVTVEDNNNAAIALYMSLGFEIESSNKRKNNRVYLTMKRKS